MNSRHYRTLVLFCCTAAACLVAAGTYRYLAERNWAQQIDTPENVAAFGSVGLRAPEFTSNAFYVAGLFLALGGCLWLKAGQAAAPLPGRDEQPDEEPTVGDEN